MKDHGDSEIRNPRSEIRDPRSEIRNPLKPELELGNEVGSVRNPKSEIRNRDSGGIVKAFDYHRPVTLAEAVQCLQQGPAPAYVLAGGTDLLVRHKLQNQAIGAVVSLRDVPGLDAIEPLGDGLRIGARVTLAQVLSSDLVSERAPVLAAAVRRMANANIRNTATVVGNVCNASPAADTAGPLLALDAEMVVVGPGGERRVPMTSWFTGPRASCLASDEVAAAVVVPRQQGSGCYERLANRRTADLALASTCIHLVVDDDGVVSDARVTLGAVAATPRRSAAAEAILGGAKLDADTIDAAAEAAMSDAQPIDDVRATAWYRREMVRNLVQRGLEGLAGGAA